MKTIKSVDSAITDASNMNSDIRVGTAAPNIALGSIFWGLSAVIGVGFLWSYWPTIASFVSAWDREADYSHGYLVVPTAIYILWARRGSFPLNAVRVSWGGLLLIGLSCLMRLMSIVLFLPTIDGWSIPVWLAGAVWLCFGLSTLRWSLPAIGFLYFMIPLPFRAETLLSVPLQGVATAVSTWILQSLTLPAIAEGHTVIVGDNTLEIEQACSGLRTLMGIAALTYVYVALVRRPWWQKALLVLAMLPIALVSNALRIVATAVLFEFTTDEHIRAWGHDITGWAAIPLAAALFAAFLCLLDFLFEKVPLADAQELVEVQAAGRTSATFS